MTWFLCTSVGTTWTRAGLVESGAKDPLARYTTVPTLGETTSASAAPKALTDDFLPTSQDAAAACARAAHALGGSALLDAVRRGEVVPMAASSACGALRVAVVASHESTSGTGASWLCETAGARAVFHVSGGLQEFTAMMVEAAAPDVVVLLANDTGVDAQWMMEQAAMLAQVPSARHVVLVGNQRERDAAASSLEPRTMAGLRVWQVHWGRIDPHDGGISVQGVGGIRQVLRHIYVALAAGRDARPGWVSTELAPWARYGVMPSVEALASGLAVWRAVRGLPGAAVAVDVGATSTTVCTTGGHAGQTWIDWSVEGDLGASRSAPYALAAGLKEGIVAVSGAAFDVDWLREAAHEASVTREADRHPTTSMMARLCFSVGWRRHWLESETGSDDSVHEERLLEYAKDPATLQISTDSFVDPPFLVEAVVGAGGCLTGDMPDAGDLGASLNVAEALGRLLSRSFDGQTVVDVHGRLMVAGMLAARAPGVAAAITAMR